MNSVNFNIVCENKKKIRIKLLIFLSLLLLFLSLFLRNESNDYIFSRFYVGGFFLWLGINFYSTFFITPFDKVGKIELNLNEIKIDNNILIYTQDIEKIEFRYKSFFGQSENYTGLAISYGNDNEITITPKNGEILKFNILLDNKRDIMNFKNIIKNYYENGVNLMYFNRKKMILPNT